MSSIEAGGGGGSIESAERDFQGGWLTLESEPFVLLMYNSCAEIEIFPETTDFDIATVLIFVENVLMRIACRRLWPPPLLEPLYIYVK